MSAPFGLELCPKWIGNNGKCTVAAHLNGEAICCQTINSGDPAEREAFAAAICAGRPGIQIEAVREALLRLASERVTKGADKKENDPTIADLLLGLASEATLFHDANSTGYARVQVADHFEVHPIRSKGFRLWLRKRLHDEYQCTAYSEALQTAIEGIEGKALFDGPLASVAVRVAEADGAVFLDLADDAWRVVRIDATGWRVIDSAPVHFVRPRGLLPLPEPVRGGSLNDLRRFLNCDDSTFVLIVAWLVACLRARGPYPVVVFSGEQGSAKSCAGRLLRGLIDANLSPLRTEPKEVRDLVIAASNSWIVALDNVSHLSGWLSDGLCRLSTGGGLSTRELYSDDQERIFDVQRPVVLNGIADFVERPDLLDRALLLCLDKIEDEDRKRETELLAAFEAAKPAILGALLDAVAVGLRRQNSVKLDRLPRLADFAHWVVAAEPGLPWAPGTFMRTYSENRAGAFESAVEGSPVGPVIVDLIEASICGLWTGTVAELLGALEDRLPKDKGGNPQRPQYWPKSARALSGLIRRLAPPLRGIGIAVDVGRRTKAGVSITLRKEAETPTPRSPHTPNPASDSANADPAAAEVNIGVGPVNVGERRDGQCSPEPTPKNRPGDSANAVGARGERDARLEPVLSENSAEAPFEVDAPPPDFDPATGRPWRAGPGGDEVEAAASEAADDEAEVAAEPDEVRI